MCFGRERSEVHHGHFLGLLSEVELGNEITSCLWARMPLENRFPSFILPSMAVCWFGILSHRNKEGIQEFGNPAFRLRIQ